MTTPNPGGYTGGIPNPTNPQQVAGAIVGNTKTVLGLLPGADAANSLIDGITASRRWIGDRHNWARVLWFVSGATLLYMGAAVLVRKQIKAGIDAAGISPTQIKESLLGATKAVVTKGK